MELFQAIDAGMPEQDFVHGSPGCLSAAQDKSVIRLFVSELNLGLSCYTLSQSVFLECEFRLFKAQFLC